MEIVGFWAAVALPLFDIPLIVRIIKRRSSSDISMMWAGGLWFCSVLMAPSAFISGDPRAIGFNVANVIMLSIVLAVVFKYRKGNDGLG
jgi:hypothetical protein